MKLHSTVNIPFVEGYTFEFLEPFDTSRLNLYLKYTEPRDRSGVCISFHKKRHKPWFRLHCRIGQYTHYPFTVRSYVACSKPEGHENELIAKRNDLIWHYDEEICNNKQELMATVIGHELGHFIATSGQSQILHGVYGVEGHRNTQSACNRLGFWFVRKFKNWIKQYDI